MKLRDHMDPSLVLVVRDAVDKRGLLERMVARARASCPEIHPALLMQRLIEREEQITTGIGHGVAIPHACIEGLPRTCCVVAQVPAGVDFEALDASPVHVAFMLLSPPQRTGAHIRLLARIARLVDQEELIARMARASGEEELFSIIVEEDRRHV